MRIALREFKGLYDHLKLRLDTIVNIACQSNTAPAILTSLQQIQLLFQDGSWVFEPKYFIRKVQMNPLEDPVDVASQANIILSYEQALEENKKEILFSQENNNFERVKLLLEVQTELNNLLTDLNHRVREKGGWRSLLYTTNGAVDMSMPLTPWKPEEQIEILQEKLRYIQLKHTEREKEHETALKQLHDTLDEMTHSRQRPSLYVSNKVLAKGPVGHASTAAATTATGGRSMSMSGPGGPAPRPHAHTGDGSVNQADTHHGAPSGARAQRHTLAYVTATSHGLAPLGIAVPLHHQHSPHHHATHQPHPEPHESSDLSPHKGALAGPSSIASSPRTIVPSGPAFLDNNDESLSSPGSPQSPKRKQSQQPFHHITPPLETQKTMSGVLGTLRVLQTTLDNSQRQQEQQHQYIRHLQSQLRQQQQHINELRHHHHQSDHQGLDVMNGSMDGESSVLSQPSQEIIEEYQQIGAIRSSNEVKMATTSLTQAMRRPSSAAGIMVTATGTEEGIISSKQRRGSMLVQHRGDAHPLEYVPVGKLITAHNLRISVNNELRDHKHLLLRPNSAGISQNPVGATRSFASIMAGGNPHFNPLHSSVGAKAPLSKLQQLETIKRQEKAMQMLHPSGTAPSLFGTHSSTPGTPTKTSEANYIPLPTLHVLPPSPKDKRKMSHSTLVKELSTIMNDSLLGDVAPALGSGTDTSDHQSIQLSSDSAAAASIGNPYTEGQSTTTSTIFQVTVSTEGITTESTTSASAAAKVDFPPPHSHTPPVDSLSPDQLLQSINTLCEQLQDSLVIHSASLKTGQELLAGMDTGSIHSDSKPESEIELYGLKIGESAIEQEHSEDKQYQYETTQRQKQQHQQHRQSSRRRSSSADQYGKERPVSSPQKGEGGSKNKGFLHTRPKTAYNHSNNTTSTNDKDMKTTSSVHSYEDILNEMLNNSSILQKHSDVSIYATTLHNRFIHHMEEMKKLEQAMKRLGKASEEDELPQHQSVAQNHYAAINIFRPQSAAAISSNTTTGNNSNNIHSYTGQVTMDSGIHTNRSQSASAATAATTTRLQNNNTTKKTRGVTTSVPFAKMKTDTLTGSGTGTSSGILPYSTSYNSELEGGGSIENNSYLSFSPRLQEHSAELSNLSEHDI